MEARTVNTRPPAAPHDDAVRCLLAIELSKKSWIVAVNTPLSDKISRYTLEACDWEGLLYLCERIRTRVAKEMKKPVEIISCYEAGYDGFWLHRVLEAHGIRNYVIDPASLQVDRRARRAKTDGVDVERMLRSLLAYLRGEPKVWSVVRVPRVAEEEDRRLHRERDRLINERVQHVNRIKGLLAIHGIYDYQPLRGDRVQRLEQLHAADGQTLPPRLKAEILRELQRLELAIRMIKAIEAERDAIASAKTGHTSAKKIQHLAKIKSIGPEFATALVGEVFYRSFDNRKQLASYVGLTPAHFQSGAMSPTFCAAWATACKRTTRHEKAASTSIATRSFNISTRRPRRSWRRTNRSYRSTRRRRNWWAISRTTAGNGVAKAGLSSSTFMTLSIPS